MKKAFTANIFSPLDLVVWGLLGIALNITLAVFYTEKADLTFGITLIVGGLIIGILEHFKNRAIEKEDLQNGKYTENCE